ncbi:MAG: DUF4965 domain-containing protein [Ruminococcaceae bacterium]|nr:DUF4965 domain-containing protein [Oscillospiraceae bacterium]
MKIERAASIPLITHDPFFSVWSAADKLNDADLVHWSGIRQKIRGYLVVNGKTYCFMGDPEFLEALPQVSLDITATSTTYTFEIEELTFTCRFTSPVLPGDLLLASRPCTYVDFGVERKVEADVTIHLALSADLVREKADKVIGFAGSQKGFHYGSMGKAKQTPLGASGDKVTIDWGYLYAASKADSVIVFDHKNEQLSVELPLGGDGEATDLILAYDDLLSINYFGAWRKAYWTETYPTILDAIGAAFGDKEETLAKAAAFDKEIYDRAYAVGGEDYAFLCSMSVRHVMAAHKIITDEEGKVIFLSKENDSNGCIGTVDVSYPSTPLFLLYNPELVKGMLRPVFRFADLEVWPFDFAPHDVGRYPYAWGQVYGLDREMRVQGEAFSVEQGAVYPPFYLYPADSGIYDFRYQMPVEECGNMLVMTAAVCLGEGNAEFAKPFWHLLSAWKEYLLEYGVDPGDQLCTDDFAGHLAHNVNLSAKAIMGVEAYAKLAGLMGLAEEAEVYHAKAVEMAKSWENRAKAGDHYALAFGNENSWSLKYNLVWDKVWGTGLFSDEVYEKELAYYEKMTNEYGVPLDNRADYTKSDWILWCAAMTENAGQAAKLIAPVAHYLKTTTTRVPFSDWYDTKTGKYVHFMGRSVQGGIFMPILAKK